MRACKRCGRKNVRTTRGAAVCSDCNDPAKMERRFCPVCGELCTIPDQIRPTGKSCLHCQKVAKAKRVYERYWSDPAFREHRLVAKRNRYERAKAEGAEWLEREREYMRAYRAEHREEQHAYYRTWAERTRSDPARRDALRQRNRERMAERRRADREYRERQRLLAREQYQRLRSDPKLWAQHLEDQRMRHRLRRARAGTPVPPVSEHAYANGNGKAHYQNGRARVPAAPLAPYVREWLGPLQGGLLSGQAYHGDVIHAAGLHQLAELASTTERTLFAILHGEREQIQRDAADRILSVVDVPFGMVYGEADR